MIRSDDFEIALPGGRRQAELLRMDDVAFLRAWREMVGQPPAVMLPRHEMVAILAETCREARRCQAASRGPDGEI